MKRTIGTTGLRMLHAERLRKFIGLHWLTAARHAQRAAASCLTVRRSSRTGLHGLARLQEATGTQHYPLGTAEAVGDGQALRGHRAGHDRAALHLLLSLLRM